MRLRKHDTQIKQMIRVGHLNSGAIAGWRLLRKRKTWTNSSVKLKQPEQIDMLKGVECITTLHELVRRAGHAWNIADTFSHVTASLGLNKCHLREKDLLEP